MSNHTREHLTGAVNVGDWSISERESATRITINDKAGKAVASVPRRADDLDIARLIVCAPELLDALRDCVRALTEEVRAAQDDDDESPSPMIEAHARAADRGAALLMKYGINP